MKKSALSLCFFSAGCTILIAALPVAGQISGVRTEELTGASFVPLQSYIMAEAGGDLLFFGGLSGMGFHSRARDGRTTFPSEDFNREVYLYDLDTQTTLSASISTLPSPLSEFLVATNAQGVQYGETLYLYGGYGPAPSAQSWATWDSVIQIDLAAVRQAILDGADLPESAFTVRHSAEAQVAGGAIIKLGPYFALVGGSNFTGNYGDEATFSNVYSNEIHLFDPAASLVNPIRTYTDDQYHRRDGNVTPVMLGAAGNQRAGFLVHIGVFKPGNEILPEVWEHPLIFDSQSRQVTLDVNFTQMMNQYEAPRVSFHSAARGENYIITLGGLSGANWDGQQFVRNMTIPWVIDVTMLKMRDSAVVSETVVGATLKPVTNAELVPNPDLPHNALGQVDWDALVAGEVLLGHFYGGIQATNPGNSAVTEASPRVYAVYATIDKFALSATALHAGQPATLSVTRADPGARVYFAYSMRGGGPTYVPSIGMSVDLSQPIVIAGQKTADAQGTAALTVTVPSGAPPIDVWLQAIERGSGNVYTKSNQVASHIEP
ncbi:MAG: hypothetical protein IT430_00135 [Phycisphaerales bacterium]|nr:hypothetical protein [Phycisphaerales bacterium]